MCCRCFAWNHLHHNRHPGFVLSILQGDCNLGDDGGDDGGDDDADGGDDNDEPDLHLFVFVILDTNYTSDMIC